MLIYYNEQSHGIAEYYQNRANGRSIGVLSNSIPNLYFNIAPKTGKVIQVLNFDIYGSGFEKIIPPKKGDIIRLLKNNINSRSPDTKSPYEGSTFEVINSKENRIELIDKENRKFTININNWVWEDVLEEVLFEDDLNDSTINDGDTITKDGKKYRVKLEEIIEQKYELGDVIEELDAVVVDVTQRSTTWHYSCYFRKQFQVISLYQDDLIKLINSK